MSHPDSDKRRSICGERSVGSVVKELVPSITCSASPFDRIDDAVLEKVFQYFNPFEIADDLYFVCKRWRTVIDNMKKTFAFNGTEDFKVLRFICIFPNTIDSIYLNGIRGSIAVILKKLRRKQKYLKRFHIDSCQIVPDNKNPYVAGRRLRNFIEVCRYLECLSLKNVEYHVSDLLDAFPLLENLRSLTIGNNSHLQVLDVIRIIVNCTKLQSLTLYRIDGITDQNMKFLLCNERLSESLRELSLDQVTELSPVAYQYILNCQNLKKLHINYSMGFSADTLMEIPIKLPHLRSLIIERACRISSANLYEFFENDALKLNEFRLTDCCSRFHDDCLEMLLKNQSRNLIHLALRNCKYLRNVNSIFEKCSYLRTLGLRGCDELCPQLKMQSATSLSIVLLPKHLIDKQNDSNRNKSILLELEKLNEGDEVIEKL